MTNQECKLKEEEKTLCDNTKAQIVTKLKKKLKM